MKITSKTKKQIQIALSAFAVASMLAICLISFCQTAQAEDPGSLKEQEENFLEETQLLKKEQEMEALQEGERPATDQRTGRTSKNKSETLPDKLMRPKNTTKSAPAESQKGQATAANSAGEIARDMACMAIDYASRFMKNFTTQDGNRWNNYRNMVFVPMALLLILPGAVLTQVRAIMAQSNPILGNASPLEGIQRGMIAICLVPGSCLVTNFAVDLGNSLHYSVCSEYSRIIGGDMYRDAMCAEIRAFGVRALSENDGSLMNLPDPDLSPRGSEPFAGIEGRIWGKISDPCTGLLLVPANRDDNTMPQASIATRLGMYTANAGICAGWGMLTAFQMAFFYYLYFAGPIMAALWAWPTQLFKNAFPIWVESCVTLAFWSFLWQIVIALLAMTKSPASSGLYMVTALNVLATTSVKHAFDCAAIMKNAVQACEQIGAEVAASAESGGGGGGKGGGKGGKKGGSKGAGKTNSPAPSAPAATPDKVAARTGSPVVTHDDEGNELPKVAKVPKVLEPTKKLGSLPGVVVHHTLPPAFRSLQPVPGTFNSLFAENPTLNAFSQTAFNNTGFNAETLNEVSWSLPVNHTTSVWDNPIPVAAPPAAPGPAPRPRNTIGSVLGNGIQDIMVYPTNVPYQDPDLVHLDKVRADIERQEQPEKVERQEEIEQEKQVKQQEQVQLQATEVAPNSVSENFLPNQSPNFPSTPDQENEMNSNEDPRIAALRDVRFNFPPPPMVSGQQAAGFDKLPSGVSLTPKQLLSKLSTVAEQAQSFAPPPPPVVSNEPALVGFSRVEGTENFDPQQEEVVTIADFTKDLQGQFPKEPPKASLNHALGSVLRQRGAWAQAQTEVKPPVPQSVGNSWWS